MIIGGGENNTKADASSSEEKRHTYNVFAISTVKSKTRYPPADGDVGAHVPDETDKVISSTHQ